MKTNEMYLPCFALALYPQVEYEECRCHFHHFMFNLLLFIGQLCHSLETDMTSKGNILYAKIWNRHSSSLLRHCL
jgi:hypothetical protein